MKTRPKSYKKIRQSVNDILERFSVKAPPVPIQEIASSLEIKVNFSPFQGKDEISGMLFRQGKEAIIGVNAYHPKNRQRFTIAHELGHFILHKGEELFIDKDFRVNVNLRDGASGEAKYREEIEANRFAAEILMPFELVLKDLNGEFIDYFDDSTRTKSLAEKYEVSQQAMSIRVTNILNELN